MTPYEARRGLAHPVDRQGAPKTLLSSLPPGFALLASSVAFVGVSAVNLDLVLFCSGVLLIGGALLWRPGESPVLLFIFSYQWVQVSVPLLFAAISGEDINSKPGSAGLDLASATWLALFAIGSLALGMRLGAGAPLGPELERSLNRINEVSLKRWFHVYLALSAMSLFAKSVAYVVPSLSQPILALATCKWAGYVALVYITFARPANTRAYMLGAFAFEFVIAIGGYFADFRSVFVFSCLGLVAARVRVSLVAFVWISLLIALSVALAVVWTAVKVEYRAYLSGGVQAQIVTVPYGDRIQKLFELVSEVDEIALVGASQQLIRRTGYIDFFAATINHVPKSVPHENGALWLDAISRPFMPRFFFPWKAEIHDSERTNQYTGLSVSGVDKGTSISIGYVGETYIDFGGVGMFPVIVMFGYLIGRVYRGLVVGPIACGVIGMGLASSTLYGLAAFESSITKTFGGLIVSLLMATLLVRFGLPRLFPWMRT